MNIGGEFACVTAELGLGTCAVLVLVAYPVTVPV